MSYYATTETVKKKADGGFRVVKVHLKRGVLKSGQKRLYIYFSGYAKSYNYFNKGVKHLSTNPVVMPLTAGASSLSGMKSAIKQNVAGSFKNTALVYFILSSAVSVAEWQADQEADGYDLAGAIIANIIKAVALSAAVTVLVSVLLGAIASVAALFSTTIVIPAIIIGTIFIVGGILVGAGIEYIEKVLTNGQGLGTILSSIFRNMNNWIKDAFTKLNNLNIDEIYGDYQYGFM